MNEGLETPKEEYTVFNRDENSLNLELTVKKEKLTGGVALLLIMI